MLITHICPKSFLSFGPDNTGIDLRPLNVLIGPNGSGKSNLIEAVDILRSAPKEIGDVTRRGGGASEWIWNGNARGSATVEWIVNYGVDLVSHQIVFSAPNRTFTIDAETVAVLRQGEALTIGAPERSDRSLLADLSDPETCPELSWLARTYEKIRIYREWSFGRHALLSQTQAADGRSDLLEEDFSNLGLFLNRLQSRFPAAKRAMLQALQDICAGITDFDTSVQVGAVQVCFTEGDRIIPAARLSDGTLRYLCLLAILCDPEPPPLICIEKPELGLHPDILPNLADLLRAASTRTQLIVTTHSDILVDAMTDTPEAVVVCSKRDGQTSMERLNADNLRPWLERYRLGQLWTQGEIGGNRW
jgi:predicted ATPase